MLHGKPRLLPAGDAAVKTIGLHVAGEALQQIGSVGGTVARMAEEDDGLVRGVGVLQRVFGDDRERDQTGTRHELLGVLVGFADVDKPGFVLGKTLESFLRGYGWKHGDSFAASA